jgi:hypothetical protein
MPKGVKERDWTEQEKVEHLAKITEYRKQPGYKVLENKAKILRRVATGSIPNASSLTTYGITLQDINEIRRANNLRSLDTIIPYFMEGTKNRVRPETEQSYIPPLPAEEPRPAPPTEVGNINQSAEGFSVADINTWMRNNPVVIGNKTNDVKKYGTIKGQFGALNAPHTTGAFHSIMSLLGPKYVEDTRQLLSRSAMKTLRAVVMRKYENKLTKAGTTKSNVGKFQKLGTMIKKLHTILITLREYPPYDALCRDPTKNRPEDCDADVRARYDEINALNSELEAKESAENYANPKQGKEVKKWKELKKMVEDKFPRGTKEHLYINMYDQFPSRDDFANLKLSTDRPPSDAVQLKNMRLTNNYIYVSKNRATIALVDYKTSNLYGPRLFDFNPQVSRDIWKYIEDNKLLAKSNRSGTLFGSGKMSSWVKKLLDGLGLPTGAGREGNINYLRKSYVSSALDDAGEMSADARVQLAFHMRHSPSSSLKYVRELMKEEGFKIENIGKSKLDELNTMKGLDGGY